MNNLNYPLGVNKNKPLPFFEKIIDGTEDKMKKISKIILCFVLTLKKHLQSNQYQDLFFRNPLHQNKIRLFSISVKF